MNHQLTQEVIAVLSCMDYTLGARYIVPLRITVLHSIENRYIYESNLV
ncbi:MAG TPA: hypothetical protein V6C90_29110 [Coleofasciculaceae cyanobacterium]